MLLTMEKHKNNDYSLTKVRDSYSETVMVDDNLVAGSKVETLISNSGVVKGVGFGNREGFDIYVDGVRGFGDSRDLNGGIVRGDGGEKEVKESDDSGGSEGTGVSGVEESDLGTDNGVVGLVGITRSEKEGKLEGLAGTMDRRIVTQVEQSAMIRNEEPRCDAFGAVISGSGRETASTVNDGIANSNFTSLDEQKRGGVENQVASIDGEEHAYSDFEAMDTDAFNAKFCFSVEELQDAPEAFTDSKCSYQETPVVYGGELETTKIRLLNNSENDQEPKGTQSLQREVKVEHVESSCEAHWDACLDSRTSCTPAHSIVGHGNAHNSHLDPSFEVSDFMDFDIDQLQYESMCRSMDADLLATSTTNHEQDVETELLGKEEEKIQPVLAYETLSLSTATDTRLICNGKDAVTSSDVKGTGEVKPLLRMKEGFGLSGSCDDRRALSSQGNLQTQGSSHLKRKHDMVDTANPCKSEGNTSTFMDASWDSIDARIVSDATRDTFANDLARAEGGAVSNMSTSSATHSFPKSSFKIGERIRRVACQMTGPPSSQNVNEICNGTAGYGFRFSGHFGSEILGLNVPSDVLLSQLHIASEAPLKSYGFLSNIIGFFSNFRNSVVVDQNDMVGDKDRVSNVVSDSLETFRFDDLKDAYWTDRVIQNGSVEQPSRKSHRIDHQRLLVDPPKPYHRSNSKMQYPRSNGNHSVKPAGYVNDKAPAELVMHFPVVDAVPSEMSLNKMFRRFGPLKEYETEIDRNTSRARVVFKRCSDAEAAYGSASKFNIFGPVLVNYQLNYTLSIPFKTEQTATRQSEEDATLLLQY